MSKKVSGYGSGTPLQLLDQLLIARGGMNYNLRGYELSSWIAYTSVTPTRTSADDPTYVLSFAGVDLTSYINIGNRVKLTQNGTVRYFVVTAISFSTNTTLTLYGGTDYNVEDTGTYPISDFAFSYARFPVGFPPSSSIWDYVQTNSTTYTKTSPVANTRYGQANTMDGGLTLPSIAVPIGMWDLSYFAQIRVEVPTASLFANCRASLSTNTSSEDTASFTRTNSINADGTSGGTLVNNAPLSSLNFLNITTKTTYYLLVSTGSSSANSIQVQGAVASTILRAKFLLL